MPERYSCNYPNCKRIHNSVFATAFYSKALQYLVDTKQKTHLIRRCVFY